MIFVACICQLSFPLVFFFFPDAHVNFTSGQCSTKARASCKSDALICPFNTTLKGQLQGFFWERWSKGIQGILESEVLSVEQHFYVTEVTSTSITVLELCVFSILFVLCSFVSVYGNKWEKIGYCISSLGLP